MGIFLKKVWIVGLFFVVPLIAFSKEGSGELDIMHHVLDSHSLDIPFYGAIDLPEWTIFGMDISPTKHVVMMWIAALILLMVGILIRKNYKGGKEAIIPKGISNVVEALVLFVRTDIAQIYIGKKADIYLPYLLTVFFFILTCNLLGLVPGAATATGNIAVTMTLALTTFIITQFSAIKTHGIGSWFAHFTAGTPVALWIIMIPVEIVGMFVKPFALMVRLFANMTAGHIAIGTLIGLIFIFKSWFAVPVSIVLALAIYALEIFVSLVQAYIFTLLSSLFIGMAVEEHDDAH